MSEYETQLVLAAYRPDGSDDSDPLVAAALKAAAEDPDLRSRFEHAKDFDASFANALASVPVPADLRANILAGAQLAGRQNAPSRKFRPAVFALAVAACLAIAGFIVSNAVPDRGASQNVANTPDWVDTSFSLLDSIVAGEASFDVLAPANDEAQTWFAALTGDTKTIPVSLAETPSVGCKQIQREDGSFALMCFNTGDGKIVHLSVHVPRPGSPEHAPGSPSPQFAVRDDWDSVSWTGENGVHYMLATAETEGSRSLLEDLVPAKTV